jgi:hypothetical protein
MITKQYRVTVALLVLAAMASLPASAGQVARKAEPLKIGKIVQLTAFYEFGPTPKLKVKNYTSYSVPRGTRINWSVTGRGTSNNQLYELKGSFTLPFTLVPGNPAYVHTEGVPQLHEAKPKAWYVK